MALAENQITLEVVKDGQSGSVGPQGPKGDKGDTGEQGPQGPQGLPGQDGADGEKGDKGDTGATGPRGPQGPTGPKGADGTDGADGKSAYESAQDGGYSGTEAQFNNQLAHAPETATNYIVEDESGLYVTDNTETLDNAVKIDSDSVDVIKGGEQIASFGEESTFESNRSFLKFGSGGVALTDFYGDIVLSAVGSSNPFITTEKFYHVCNTYAEGYNDGICYLSREYSSIVSVEIEGFDGDFNPYLDPEHSDILWLGISAPGASTTASFRVTFVGVAKRNTQKQVKMNGEVTVNGDRVLTRPSLVVEQYSEHSSKSVGTSGANSTYNISKPGYMPIGVVGFYVSNANVLCRACYLTNIQEGSATINYYMRSVSGTNTVTQTTRVLWVKI